MGKTSFEKASSAQTKLKESRSKILNKWFYIAIGAIVVAAVAVALTLFFVNKKAEKKAAVVDTTLVPYQISRYDVINEKSIETGTDYVIFKDSQGNRIKVTSDGQAYYVDSNGNRNGFLTDDQVQKAVATAQNYAQTNDQVRAALGDLAESYTYSINGLSDNGANTKTVGGVKINFSTEAGKSLEKALEDKNITTDGFLNALSDQITASGMSMKDIESAAESLGMTVEEFLNELVNNPQGIAALPQMLEEARNNGWVPESQSSPFTRTGSGTSTGTSRNGEVLYTLGSQGFPVSVEVSRVGTSAVNTTTDSNGNVSTTTNSGEWLNTITGLANNSTSNSSEGSMAALVNALSTLSGTSQSPTAAEAQGEWMEKSQDGTVVAAGRLDKWDLAAGTVVPITLVTSINSDLPGNVVGIVRQNVYDTLTGSNIVIPKGSRVMATYNNSVQYGQTSLQIAWNYLITPDGYTYTLPGFAGVTGDGYSGVKGSVNNHFWSILGATVLGSIMDYGAETLATIAGQSIEKSVSNSYGAELLELLVSDSLEATQSVGQRYIDRAITRQPTIKIQSGTLTQLLVNQTVSFKR